MPGLKTNPSTNRTLITQDRRIFARLPVALTARLLNPDNGMEAEAETVDISANGVGIVTARTLTRGTPLEMWLHIPDAHDPLYSRGRVVWSQPLAHLSGQRVGISLERAQLMGLARILWLKRAQAQ